jgi:hypothetical protein
MAKKKRKRTPKFSAEEWARRGGKARAKKLTPEQRSEQARRAVQARWERYRKERSDKS